MFQPPEHVPCQQEISYHIALDAAREKFSLEHPSLDPIDWVPGFQRGPQTRLGLSPARFIIFGGAAGGGKTHGTLLAPLGTMQAHPGFDVTMFRKTMADAEKPGSLIAETKLLYTRLQAVWVGSPKNRWTFPNSSTITIAHLQHEKYVVNHRGSQNGGLIFDEGTLFERSMVFGLLQRLRSTVGGISFLKMTTNPQHEGWVRDLLIIMGYVDPLTGWPRYEMSGVIKYFYTGKNDEVVPFCSRKEALLWWKVNFPGEWARYKAGKRILREPMSFTFIPSRLEDNKLMLRKSPDYESDLENLTEAEVLQMRWGNWNAVQEVGAWFVPHWCGKKLQIDPDGEHDFVFKGMPKDLILCRGYDLAYTAPKPGNDPDYTVGVLLGYSPSTLLTYVIDVVYGRYEGIDFSAFVVETAQADAAKYGKQGVTISLPAGGVEKQIASTLILGGLRGYKTHTSPDAGSKEGRFAAFSEQAKNTGVRIIENHGWNDFYLNQLSAFKGKATKGHDDCVDATSRANNCIIEGASVKVITPGDYL